MVHGSEPSRYLRFGRFALDLHRGCLLLRGEEIPLRPKSFAVLEILVTRPGVLVERQDLMNDVWGSVIVTEASLSQCMVEIRQALGDTDYSTIRTVPRRGYIFELPVTTGSASEGSLVSRFKPQIAALVAAVIVAGALVTASIWSRDERVQLALAPGVGTEAAAYLERGQHFYARRGHGDIERAREEFERAIELEPDLVEAWTGLAATVFVEYNTGPDSRELLDVLETAIGRALALSPDDAAVLIRAAQVERAKGNWQLARALSRQALLDEPGDPLVLAVSASWAAEILDFARAVELQMEAEQADPLSAVYAENLAWFQLMAGHYEAALSAFAQAARLSPDAARGHADGVALALAMLGRNEAAASALRAATLEDRTFARMVALVVEAQREGAAAVADAMARLERSADARDLVITAALHAHVGQDHEAVQLMSAARSRVDATWPYADLEELEFLLWVPLFRGLETEQVFLDLYQAVQNAIRGRLQHRYTALAQR